MSPYALLTGAILALLAAPLIWMACKVARDHVAAGVALTAGLLALVVALHAHRGTRLVDITFGVVGLAAVVLVAVTVSGVFARRSPRVRRATSELPPARLHRGG